ncbi:MAG: dTMP kinase [Pikeienuella sp.]
MNEDQVQGLFVTIEGIDGAGKSTQARLLADRLRATGRQVVLTREPGGAPGAEEIRALLVEGDPDRWSPTTEMLLFFAARQDHVEKTIRPALDAGAVVICDRFTDSTRAYQATARPADAGAARAKIDLIHDQIIQLDPDLTLVFDMDPSQALNRGLARDNGDDRFEQMGDGFQAKLRDNFQSLVDEFDRCVKIDAQGEPDEVATRVWAAFRDWPKLRGPED